MGVKRTLPIRRLFWRRSWRIIPTRYPEKNLYEQVADPQDLNTIRQVELLTNQRERLESGQALPMRPTDKLPQGRGAYNVTAAFSHLSPSRFSDGTFPVYYAARALQTAINETCYHREAFMRATAQKPMPLLMRVLVAQIRGSIHDLRGKRQKLPDIYSLTHYEASQRLGRRLWLENSNGVGYDSVRHRGGQCIGVFAPQLIHHARQERCLQYDWDGQKVARVYELHEFPRR